MRRGWGGSHLKQTEDLHTEIKKMSPLNSCYEYIKENKEKSGPKHTAFQWRTEI